MARYTGPACKLCRREGKKLFLKGDRCYTSKCAIERRSYAPGQHGQNRKKTSEYGLQLRAKQSARRYYGVSEGQFHKYFLMAERKEGVTGTNLLQLCESRLDNIVYRLGIAPTRRAARQLVNHKHISVDGKVVGIASYAVKPGQIIGVRERAKNLEVIADSLAGFNHSKYPWLEWDEATKSGKLLHKPEQLIVELYSK